MDGKEHFRGYVNPFPPGALAEASQIAMMPQGAEIYVEDRWGRQIKALVASLRKADVVAVTDLYLFAPGAFRPQKRRRLLGENVEAVQKQYGDILELTTGHRAKRKLPAMMLRAYEMIAASGRKRSRPNSGAPPKWVFTPAELEVIQGLWRSRKFKNDSERTLAIQQRIGKPIPRATLRRRLGSPHGN